MRGPSEAPCDACARARTLLRRFMAKPLHVNVVENLWQHVLKKNPSIYDRLKGKRTQKGVTLAACVKTGMDNKGHPMIKIVGMTAGDEDSYEVFKDLFDPVFDIRHGGYAPNAKKLAILHQLENIYTVMIVRLR